MFGFMGRGLQACLFPAAVQSATESVHRSGRRSDLTVGLIEDDVIVFELRSLVVAEPEFESLGIFHSRCVTFGADLLFRTVFFAIIELVPVLSAIQRY